MEDFKSKIIIDNRITEKYTRGIERTTTVKEIVIHATAGDGDTIGWMAAGGYMGKDTEGNKIYRANDYKKGVGLFHFNIKRDGSVIQIIDPLHWVYHSSCGKHDEETIGIELSKASPKNADAVTNEQMNTLLDLIAYLRTLFPTITTLASHDYNAKRYSNKDPKPCPGLFNWELLKSTKLKINS
jgi:N-acetyl-anhydromuramyl-L-alanine amidase AmpD